MPNTYTQIPITLTQISRAKKSQLIEWIDLCGNIIFERHRDSPRDWQSYEMYSDYTVKQLRKKLRGLPQLLPQVPVTLTEISNARKSDLVEWAVKCRHIVRKQQNKKREERIQKRIEDEKAAKKDYWLKKTELYTHYNLKKSQVKKFYYKRIYIPIGLMITLIVGFALIDSFGKILVFLGMMSGPFIFWLIPVIYLGYSYTEQKKPVAKLIHLAIIAFLVYVLVVSGYQEFSRLESH